VFPVGGYNIDSAYLGFDEEAYYGINKWNECHALGSQVERRRGAMMPQRQRSWPLTVLNAFTQLWENTTLGCFSSGFSTVSKEHSVFHRQGKNLESTKMIRSGETNESIQNYQLRALYENRVTDTKVQVFLRHNRTEPNNNHQHTIRTKVQSYRNKAYSCTRMPSVEPQQRPVVRRGSSQNQCGRCGDQLRR
jgi:hypothetical protein